MWPSRCGLKWEYLTREQENQQMIPTEAKHKRMAGKNSQQVSLDTSLFQWLLGMPVIHFSPALGSITLGVGMLSLKQIKGKHIIEITKTISMAVNKYIPCMRNIRPERSQLSFDELDLSRNSNCPKSKVCPSLSIRQNFPCFEMQSEKFPPILTVGAIGASFPHSHFKGSDWSAISSTGNINTVPRKDGKVQSLKMNSSAVLPFYEVVMPWEIIPSD